MVYWGIERRWRETFDVRVRDSHLFYLIYQYEARLYQY